MDEEFEKVMVIGLHLQTSIEERRQQYTRGMEPMLLIVYSSKSCEFLTHLHYKFMHDSIVLYTTPITFRKQSLLSLLLKHSLRD